MRISSLFSGCQRLGLAFSFLLFGACTPGSGPADEPVGNAHEAVFTNGGFEIGGTAITAPWTVQTYINNGITVQTPQTRAGLKLQLGGDAVTTQLNASNQPDPDLGMTASLRRCRYGSQCAVVNFHGSLTYGHSKNVNGLSQTMNIGSGDVDPSDGQVHVRFAVAPVLQNPSHPADEQPYYFVQVTNTTTNTILYTDFNLSAQAGVPWKTINGGTANEIDYVDWALVDVAPGPSKLAAGDAVKLEIIAGGCSVGLHFGEVYVDGVGSTVPGLFVSGVGPAQTNPGSLVSYDMMYKNGSAAAATGVVINFKTPPNTTFQSITPPANATCTSPTVGTAGTITCTFAGPVAVGASDTFHVSVNLADTATGTLVCGSYDIHSNQETTLVGSKIVTTIGCAADADCATGKWCNISGNQCTAKLSNGSAVPSDALHTSPTLNGTCSAAAGTLVCQSTVCDTLDNKCGYDINHGPCTAGNTSTVCRSGSCSTNLLCQPSGGCNVDGDCTGGQWCNETAHACTVKLTNGNNIPTDAPHSTPTLNGTCSAAAGTLVCQASVCDSADDKCGYDVGHGICTIANGGVLCRSGVCGTDGNCRPAGGCNVDADCATGKWCQQSSRTCQATLANGAPLPTDAPHTNPVLDGGCTVPAATLVCQSAVCDSADNQCGFATGHGPCTTANGATVCRSASCSANGLCQPAADCKSDSDCTMGKWCNVSRGACLPLLGNGTAIPSDSPHANPTLDGICTEPAATLVCVSGVCDTRDEACGFASGVGPCTAANASSVCRSGRCGSSGTSLGICVNCTDDAHCSGDTPICNRSTGNCVGCVSSDACGGATPICDASQSICVACNGDHGSAATDPCASDAAPFCFLSGPAQGTCGKCATDANCTGHVGNVCDVSGGSCKGGCRLDTDCSNREWCNENKALCLPKLGNGTPLPGEPVRVATCSVDVGRIVCQSAVCDPTDGNCGLAPGDGPCESSDQCRLGGCNADTQLCRSGCAGDADCSTNEYCGSTGACTELVPVGAECSTNHQCKTHDCTDNVCSGLIASGSGVACATRPVGSSGPFGAGLVLALIAAFVPVRRWRRRAARATTAAE
ncbi:MAG: hypothetical protein WDO69_11960 [Pseudomonadota bacterium]